MARRGRISYSEQAEIEAQAHGIDGNAALLDLDEDDGDLLSQVPPGVHASMQRMLCHSA